VQVSLWNKYEDGIGGSRKHSSRSMEGGTPAVLAHSTHGRVKLEVAVREAGLSEEVQARSVAGRAGAITSAVDARATRRL